MKFITMETTGKTGRRRTTRDQPPVTAAPDSSLPAAPAARPAARTAGRPARGPGRVRRLRLLFAIAAVALATAMLSIGSRLIPDLSSRPEYQITPARITIKSTPRWIPGDIIEQVFDKAAESGPLSLLDETLSERLAAAFHTHPWVLRVLRVHKSWPARVQVEVEWRRPVAMIAGIDGFYPVDQAGVLLPTRDFSPADLRRYPVIENIESVPLGRVGEPWGDPVVNHAAALAAALLEPASETFSWWEHLSLAAIVAPHRATLNAPVDDLEFQLRTTGGSMVLWGRGPDSLHPAELSTSRKLERLVEFTERFGSIDDAHGPWQLDIRSWQGMRRSLLAAEPGSKSQPR